ncbi:hypothetical protein EJ02DRAFT_436203 [Clathrospora elynae]|uniref:Uncharacterized protein n=1 Tax=Clathrospora elynae TaxID=706981 RepID=A0A6A5SIZ3_9PLEO|nr:hypothetical protein EJ02DRAFT_436203 [Clathrospora elynae]
MSPNTKRCRWRTDSETRATRSTPSPTPRPAAIRVFVTPKLPVPVAEPMQTENKYNMYNRPASPSTSSPSASSTQTSCSTSPVKSMPNFGLHNPVEGDSIFGYKSMNLASTGAGASSKSGSDGEKGRKNPKNKTQEQLKKEAT